jgi:hypothetical protein
MIHGDKDLVIENYRKSLELNSDNRICYVALHAHGIV